MPLNAQNDIASRIEDAVFELMATTPVQSIKVAEVLRLAHTSKSTFYRCYRSVDDVVKRFEDELLQNMQDINDVALEARFGDAQLDPTPTMIKRMEILQANRSKVLALNSDNGDPVFAHKATIFMHDYFRNRLRSTFSDETDLDLYLAFALAGHHNLIQYWLEAGPTLRRAPLLPRSIACSTHRCLSTMRRATGTHASPILKSRSGERLIFRDERLHRLRIQGNSAL
mgnify:CR=1 FL=1